jgi:hypothetical protein
MVPRSALLVILLAACGGKDPPPQVAQNPAPSATTSPADKDDDDDAPRPKKKKKASIEPQGPMSDDTYRSLYLERGDLPGMRLTQDSRDKGADPGDKAFNELGGLKSGMVVWMGDNDAPVWRVADIRWVFPTVTAAKKYHEAQLQKNSEGENEADQWAPVGSECHVFGGTRNFQSVRMTHYFYIFRKGRTVVKLYVAQGPNVQGQKLTPDVVKPIADKVAARVGKK